MSATKEYQKLPGRGTRFEGARLIAGVRKSCTVWLAADHILLIFTTSFIQEFKRLYLRDIQAITVRQTTTARNLSIALAVIAAIFGVIAIIVQDPVGRGILLGLFITFGILALINTLRGPSCIAEIKTAVQTEELSSLKCLRVARKTISILRPLIEEAQGKMSAEEIQVAAGIALEKSGDARAGISGHTQILSAVKFCSGRVHQWLFFLLLLIGLLHTLSIFFHPVALIVLATLLELLAAGLVITALIKQYETDLSHGLRRLTWIATGYIGISYLISAFVGSFISADNPSVALNQWLLLEHVAELEPFEMPWLLGALVFSSVCSLILGTIGIILTRTFREQKRKASAPPAFNVSSNATP